MKPPETAFQAFQIQRRNARQRQIAFLLTFEEWWDWWQVDNRWANRGRRGRDLVMARRGDIGPYSLENVYCSTAWDNAYLGRCLTDACVRGAETRRKHDDFAHLRNRAVHPRCRQVTSPKGSFPSIALAAEANGIKAKYAQFLASKTAKGWAYAT
jgi:hypothetical protein